MKTVYAIEGLDRLGKSTLIDGIRNQIGYYEIIHFSKPQKLKVYSGANGGRVPVAIYQEESFRNSMLLAKSGARIIFDRWHLGEFVYAPMYRAYSGEYVFDIEKRFNMQDADVRLILLTENFSVSRHFVDDGESLGTMDKREEEQNRFIEAFNRSIIRDKRTVCVTDPALGGFKPKDWILQEALA